jgi:hypothetical protein
MVFTNSFDILRQQLTALIEFSKQIKLALYPKLTKQEGEDIYILLSFVALSSCSLGRVFYCLFDNKLAFANLVTKNKKTKEI